jgi:hypothetical protein
VSALINPGGLAQINDFGTREVVKCFALDSFADMVAAGSYQFVPEESNIRFVEGHLFGLGRVDIEDVLSTSAASGDVVAMAWAAGGVKEAARRGAASGRGNARDKNVTTHCALCG